MSAEIRDPRRTLPRAVFAAGALIALMYIAGTVAVLVLVSAPDGSATSGVFHAITLGAITLKIGLVGILAAILVAVGNAGGGGKTVVGVGGAPVLRGGCREMPGDFRQLSRGGENA